jgi:hypothetical protein
MPRVQFASKRHPRNQNLRDGGHFIASSRLCAAQPNSEPRYRANRWRIIAYVVVALFLLFIIVLAVIQHEF